MLANLPPGVTGNETYFDCDIESEAVRYCESCDRDTPHYIWRHRRLETTECHECLHESESELGPDSI